MDPIKLRKFSDLNIQDKFFDSLKKGYDGFEKWYAKKVNDGEKAYVFLQDDNLEGFLYLKPENEEDNTIQPKLPKLKRLKVGTFKINAHGTVLGERFMKIILDELFDTEAVEAYVTIFPEHGPLIELFETFGFEYYGKKISTSGKENVYIKNKTKMYSDIYKNYPKIDTRHSNKALLSIYPEFHTTMFPDSKLNTEKSHIIEDISATNSIEKIYLTAARRIINYKKGDCLVIYRTADGNKPAEFSAVATSIYTIVEIKHIDEFENQDEFLKYCERFSVFTESELKRFWLNKRFPYLVKMLYNTALPKRPIRKDLADQVGINRDIRWTLVNLEVSQFDKIIELGEVNESLIID